MDASTAENVSARDAHDAMTRRDVPRTRIGGAQGDGAPLLFLLFFLAYPYYFFYLDGGGGWYKLMSEIIFIKMRIFN